MMTLRPKNHVLIRLSLASRNTVKAATLTHFSFIQFFSSSANQSKSNSTLGPKIYTKTGDAGTSSLFNLERRSKYDAIFNALGTVDELNAHIGLNIDNIKQFAKENKELSEILVPQLQTIQNDLFSLGSAVATPRTSSSPNQIAATQFNAAQEQSLQLEAWIDQFTAQLPKLTNFILPSGGIVASSFHVSRAVCRRAERLVQSIVDSEKLEQNLAVYLNRLSDYLFTTARYSALIMGHQETLWSRKMNKKTAQ
jgi:cob(I)alamin adenosyltransferase